MTTKAKRRKGRGYSKAGRPKKDGPRTAGGRLVQKVEPNQVVVGMRREMLGPTKPGAKPLDQSLAEDPIALAHARGWLTKAQVEAGDAFASAYRASHVTRRHAGLNEAPDLTERDVRKISEMHPTEIVELFDKMMEGTNARATSEDRQIKSRKLYNELSQRMTTIEQVEVFNAFILRQFPQWLTWRIVGRAPTVDSARRCSALLSGLEAISKKTRKNADGPLTVPQNQETVEMKASPICVSA